MYAIRNGAHDSDILKFIMPYFLVFVIFSSAVV